MRVMHHHALCCTACHKLRKALPGPQWLGILDPCMVPHRRCYPRNLPRCSAGSVASGSGVFPARPPDLDLRSSSFATSCLCAPLPSPNPLPWDGGSTSIACGSTGAGGTCSGPTAVNGGGAGSSALPRSDATMDSNLPPPEPAPLPGEVTFSAPHSLQFGRDCQLSSHSHLPHCQFCALPLALLVAYEHGFWLVSLAGDASSAMAPMLMRAARRARVRTRGLTKQTLLSLTPVSRCFERGSD
eukprot:981222-Amphidinium_carterae.2